MQPFNRSNIYITKLNEIRHHKSQHLSIIYILFFTTLEYCLQQTNMVLADDLTKWGGNNLPIYFKINQSDSTLSLNRNICYVYIYVFAYFDIHIQTIKQRIQIPSPLTHSRMKFKLKGVNESSQSPCLFLYLGTLLFRFRVIQSKTKRI